MPKRNNPFGDHSCLQLKTHIGTKEVDKGVDQQNRMQSVYERTKKLLFDGMRKELGNVGNNNNNNAFWKSQEDETTVKPDSMKQMHLNKFCQLVEEEGCEMEVDDCNKEDLDAPPVGDHFMQGFNVQKHEDGAACQSFPFPNKHIDFRFTQSQSERHTDFKFTQSGPRMTDFVSASSLTCNDSRPRPSPFKGNVFEQLKQAQMLTSRSHFTSGACHSCRHPVHNRDVMKCQFCENYVCGKCSRQCCSCFLHFCPLCSILNYTAASERAFCFNCNGK